MPPESTRRLEARATSFDVGECLGLGFSVWAKNLLPFALITALVQAPLLAYALLAGPWDPENPGSVGAVRLTVHLVGGYVLSLIATGAVTYGVVQQLRRQPASIGASLRVGLSRLPSLILVGLLLGVILGVGFLLLLVPGLILMCVLWVAVPAAVIEGLGPRASLGRSARLTKGSRWAIFVTIFVLVILQGVVSFVVDRVLEDAGTAAIVASFVVENVLSGSLMAVVNAVGYWLLRSKREGATIEDLARVFD